jgi:hypothetical protein
MPKTIRNEYYKKLSYESLMRAHLESRKGKSTRNNKIEKIRKNYCTGVKIMVSSRWSIYIYNVYRIST